MKKRIIIGLLSSVVALSMITACGKTGSQEKGNTEEAGNEQASESAEEAVSDDVVSEENTEEAEDTETSEEISGETPDEEESLHLNLEQCEPCDILPLEDGSFLVADSYSKKILSVKENETEVFAGCDSVVDIYGKPLGGYNDDVYEEALFKSPYQMAEFFEGIAVSDPDNKVVRFIRDGIVQTANASLDGTGNPIDWEYPTGLTTDDKGNLYVSDTHKGVIYGIDIEGSASIAVKNLNSPMGICFHDGALYVAETGANKISRVPPKGESLLDGNVITETVAGSGEEGLLDGDALEACFSSPQGITVADDGTIYVADTINSAVRKIRDGKVETILSSGDEDLSTSLVSPTGLCVSEDTLYICDRFTGKILTLVIS